MPATGAKNCRTSSLRGARVELRTALAQSLRAIHVEHEHNRGGADEGTLGTIDDPLAELGSTLFHLSHQGLNDVVLMQELVSTLGVIAPSLNFVVPRVERPELRALDAPPPVRVGCRQRR